MTPDPSPPDHAGRPESLVGAALSFDGVWLDAVTNIAPSSQIFPVAGIDVARRSIAHWLDLTAPMAQKLSEGFGAFSANLDRLAVGETIQAVPGTDTATAIHVFAPGTGRETWRIRIDQPLAFRLVFAPDGRSLYALGQGPNATLQEPFDYVYVLWPTGQALQPVFGRPGEGISRIFLGP